MSGHHHNSMLGTVCAAATTIKAPPWEDIALHAMHGYVRERSQLSPLHSAGVPNITVLHTARQCNSNFQKMATDSEPRKKRARHGFRYQMELYSASEDAKQAFLSRMGDAKRLLASRGSLPLSLLPHGQNTFNFSKC